MIDHKNKNTYKKKLAAISFFGCVLIIVLFYQVALAITTDKTEYWSDEGILLSGAVAPNNALFLYDLSQTDNAICATSEEQIQSAGSAGLASVCSITGNLMPAGSYSLIELNSRRANCNGLSYVNCKESSSFVNEALFLVKGLPPPPPPVVTPSGGGGTPVPEPEVVDGGGGGGGGPTAYRPEVGLYSPLDGKTYGTVVDVIYEATDKNDILGQLNLGLDDNPVTIYYSNTSDTRQRFQIGSQLPVKGVFKWNTKDLPEGDTYNIIVSATDKVRETGESVSGDFSIDHSAPVFTIKTEPTVTKGEDVIIIVDSTKELVKSPLVKVAQNEFNFFVVEMIGSGKHFEGIYRVVKGYDGPARITITGTDLSGNISNLIVAGGQFSVGVLPPPKPIIISPLDRDIVSKGAVEVTGKARKDTEVILSVNGSDRYSKMPNVDGSFTFTNVNLKPDFNSGSNFLSFVSKDATGNISESTDIVLKYNLEPELFINFPITGQTIGTSTIISIKASDKNKDKLKFDYEVSGDKGLRWNFLAESSLVKEHKWDTTMFQDGIYSLRVSVNDGTFKKSVIVENLTIKNLLPIFSFVDGERSVINEKEYTIRGAVAVSSQMIPRGMINAVEYSLDGENNWISVNADSSFNLPEVGFSLKITTTEEKTYKVLFRAKDNRGVYGKGLKTIIAIFEPPVTPVVTSLKEGAVIDASLDENREKAGVQITVKGDSKPGSVINIESGGVTASGKTDQSGKFAVTDVTIREHGKNVISILALDEAGNKSFPANISVVYNNPPTLKFQNPRHGTGLNHLSVVEYTTVDPDGDPILKTILSMKKPGGKDFRVLDINSVDGKFELNVSDFKEGFGYELRLESTDGVSSSFETVQFAVDNTAPTISLNPVSQNNFKKYFKFEATGKAVDNFSGIEFVEYTLDEEHWFKALITKGFLGKQALFSIKHPFVLDDGEYDIKMRSIDSAGNYSVVSSQKIVVDTMPPRVGSYELSFSGIPMYPEGDRFKVVLGEAINMRLSLEADTKEASLFLGDDQIDLRSNPSNNLWEAELSFNNEGVFPIKISATDEFGNFIQGKNIGTIEVVSRGKVELFQDEGGGVISGAQISVIFFNENQQDFQLWPAEYYGMQNPVTSAEDGLYSLFLPSGKYQIKATKNGFVNVISEEFTLHNPKFVNTVFNMKKRVGVRGFIEDMLQKSFLLSR